MCHPATSSGSKRPIWRFAPSVPPQLVVVFIALAVLMTASIDAVGCPQKCSCQQRTVRCVKQQFDKIPEMPPDTNIVDFRFNHIREVPSEAFAGLSHLHTVFLNENQITRINSAAFHGLPSLKYLYLNKNRIVSIAPNAFEALERLQSLYLHFNNITTFERQTFSDLPALERLFLYGNQIRRIPEGAFEGLTSLKRLRLDDNPLECDCSLLGFRKMLQDARKTLLVTTNCATPEAIAGKNLLDLTEEDFHCSKPEIVTEPKDIEISYGQTAVFTCKAVGDPRPEIVWMLDSNEIHSDDTRISVLPDGSLRINEVTAADAGHYECMAKNNMGETHSRPVQMTVDNEVVETDAEAPKFIQTPPAEVTLLEGQPIALHCVVTGAPTPSILWKFNNQNVQNGRIKLFGNGSLIVSEATLDDGGIYSCYAGNAIGNASVNATVHVNANTTAESATPYSATSNIAAAENTTALDTDHSLTNSTPAFNKAAPRITLAPGNVTAKTGAHVTLECEADGNPLPHIWWKRNGQPLSETNRMYLSDDNIELTIEHVKESDSGNYICVAESELGSVEAAAEVAVINDVGPPRFLFEPYDLEAIEGTTIELPCKAEEDDDILQTKWRKDGRTLTQTDKYRLSPTGSLFISNLTEADQGRYECSLLNQYGRATASGLLTVKKKLTLLPGDQFVRIAITEASREVDLAINQTIAKLFSGSSNRTQHHGDLFRIVRFPSGPARELARAAEVYERTLVNIRKHVDSGSSLTTNKTDFNYNDLLSPDYLDLLAQLSGCMAHRVTPNCTDLCFHAKFRTLDGSCNNYKNPSWGSSLTGFRRLLPPIYENGFNMPVGWNKTRLYQGFSKPSARLVSTSLISTTEITPDDRITHMVMQWGQFLDHDLDHAIPSVSSESWDGVDCKKTCEYAAPCYPIEIPESDPRVHNRRCIDFVRSSAVCGSGMTSIFFGTVQPREQINQLTAFIDGSQVYGYTESFARDLRNLTTDDGLLREGPHFPKQKSLLPFAAPTDGIDCRRNLDESTVNCFTAGDIRVNEQLGLLTMHIIWFREHNRIAGEFRKINPQWDGDKIYFESRKIVGAMMQHITYKHWLPEIIGERGMALLGEYQGYDAGVNPSIANEFATAALRFGHSLINPILHRLNESFEPIAQGHIPLHKAFFAPWRIVYEGGVDPLLRGLISVPAKLKKPNQNLNSDLTEKLFETAHAVALDLAAINIQRSRDHAMPGYNDYRKFCNMKAVDSFEELKQEITNGAIRDKLKELYGNPDNIDLWVGGILEDQLPGAKVGPLFTCLLVEQFKKLRDGDRFWYENDQFKPEQLAQIKKVTLGRVLCDNGDNITRTTDNVFVLPAKQGGYKHCDEIPQIDFEYWVDCSECSRHHKRYTPLVRQRRSIRAKRDIDSQLAAKPDPENHLDDNTFIDDDMNEERIEGLESLIESFQKSMKQMRRKIRKLEQQCSVTAAANSSQYLMKGKPHGHCVDSKGIKRLNNEIWMRDDCTKCECEHRQISCETEKCAELICENGLVLMQEDGKCCPICSVDDSGPSMDAKSVQ
ncbi:peroxidasin isoform X2 [Toxorhynchites rutilus septentrionalis]|uniref:peroxidasin isoform X2 n=1 Tax=Toxorhynchites rutilus septentrionalis TaxID=329112 RepID=UPI0024789E4F|nr:peroxidasin isoform X2 [Toxorhynchites rutilus septentrionalis]